MATPVVAPGLDALATHFGLSLVDSDGNPVTCEEAEEAQKEEEQAEEDKESNEPSPPVGSLPSFTSIYQGEPDSEGEMFDHELRLLTDNIRSNDMVSRRTKERPGGS